MDLDRIRIFREVARLGSFTAAARTLGYTQSAVSRQVFALETAMGSVLFDRLPRGVRLTQAGRSLLGHAEAVLDRLAAAHSDLAALRNLTAGRLRVGAVASTNAALLPRALAEFRRAHPKVVLTVQEAVTRELLPRLRGDDIDIAVVSDHGTPPWDRSGLDVHPLLEDPMLVALPRDHRFAARGTLRLAELADEDWIVGSLRIEETLISAALHVGLRPRIDFVVREWIAKLGFVAAGLGVTLVPAVAASGIRADVALLPLHPADNPVRRVSAVTAVTAGPRPAVGPFLQHLRDAAASLVPGTAGAFRRSDCGRDEPQTG